MLRMDNQIINGLYSSALNSLSKENEMMYNSFIAYQNMISEILELPTVTANYNGQNDIFISFASINRIIKNHLDILNKQNSKIAEKLANMKIKTNH
jgi:hypothetical protein